MVKLIKKPPGYAGLSSVYAYTDETWIPVAFDATAGPDSTSAGTLGGGADIDSEGPMGGGRSRQQIRDETAEVAPVALSGFIGFVTGGFVGCVVGIAGHLAVENATPPIQDAIRGTGPDEETPPETDEKKKSKTGN